MYHVYMVKGHCKHYKNKAKIRARHAKVKEKIYIEFIMVILSKNHFRI